MLFANIMLAASIICFVTGMMVILDEHFFHPKTSSKDNKVFENEIERLKTILQDKISELSEKDIKIARLSKQIQTIEADYNEYQQSNAGIDELKVKLKGKIAEVSEKGLEIDKLNAKLAQITDTPKAEVDELKARLEEKIAKVNEKDLEIKKLKNNLQASIEESKAKDPEIEKLSAKLAESTDTSKERDEKIAALEKLDFDLAWIKESVDEEKKNITEMKQRVEENKMKMQLLSEKTKDGVELIATFAQGKEFDEFRKSIHLDEIIRKYEDEIKGLRIRNMELDNRFKDLGR